MQNRKAVEYLLLRGINPNLSNNTGKTAMHYAIEFQSLPMLCYLCEGSWNPPFSESIIKSEDFKYDFTKKLPNWVNQVWKALDYSATVEIGRASCRERVSSPV